MGRIDTSRWHTKMKHEHTILEIGSLIVDLETCLKAGAPIDPTTRQDAIYTIEAGRRDIERCRGGVEAIRKGIADQLTWDHIEAIRLLTDLNMALKLNKPYDMDLLDRLEAEIDKLEDCRESMISYRHVRGRGYVK